jgi:hypothetical protein
MHWGHCAYSKTAKFGGVLCKHTIDARNGEETGGDGHIGNRGQLSVADG